MKAEHIMHAYIYTGKSTLAHLQNCQHNTLACLQWSISAGKVHKVYLQMYMQCILACLKHWNQYSAYYMLVLVRVCFLPANIQEDHTIGCPQICRISKNCVPKYLQKKMHTCVMSANLEAKRIYCMPANLYAKHIYCMPSCLHICRHSA